MTNDLLPVFSGPSGVEKDMVLHELLRQNDSVRLSISTTTRSPRPGEIDEKDYFSVTREHFQEITERGEMLEYIECCGSYYGTPAVSVREWQEQGLDVILETKVQGDAQIKRKRPDCVSVFLLPPSLEVLESHLCHCASDTEEVIQEHMESACGEILEARHYDHLIVNDTVDHAVEQVCSILCAEKLRFGRADADIKRMLDYAEIIT